jgi:hypothetical protein
MQCWTRILNTGHYQAIYIHSGHGKQQLGASKWWWDSVCYSLSLCLSLCWAFFLLWWCKHISSTQKATLEQPKFITRHTVWCFWSKTEELSHWAAISPWSFLELSRLVGCTYVQEKKLAWQQHVGEYQLFDTKAELFSPFTILDDQVMGDIIHPCISHWAKHRSC